MNLKAILPFSTADRFHREVLANLGSVAALGLAGVALNVLILRLDGPEGLGVFNQIYALYIFLSQLAVAGVHISAHKHVSHHQEDPETCAGITASALLLATALSLVSMALALALREPAGRLLSSPEVGQGLVLAAPGLLFFSLNKVLLGVVNGLRAMMAYALFQSLRPFLLLAAVACLLAARTPPSWLGLSFTLSEAALFLLILPWLCLRHFRPRLPADLRGWCAEHLSFGGRSMLGGMLAELNTRVDVLMLGHFTTSALVGIYSFAATLAEGLGQVNLVLSRNASPILGGLFAKGDRAGIEETARRFRRIFFRVMLGIGSAGLLAYPLVAMLFRDLPLGPSWTVFAILVAGQLVAAGYRPFDCVLVQGGRPGLSTILVAASVGVNAGLCLALIPALGIYGAALAAAAAFLTQVLLLVLCARRALGIRL